MRSAVKSSEPTMFVGDLECKQEHKHNMPASYRRRVLCVSCVPIVGYGKLILWDNMENGEPWCLNDATLQAPMACTFWAFIYKS